MTPATLSNRQLGELLALQSDQEPPGSDRRRALRRASRRSLLWPAEAASLLALGEKLTSLSGVGPFVAYHLRDWIETGVAAPEPPPERRDFWSLTAARAFLADTQVRANGDLQMHTTYSDGKATVEEMARACAAAGYRFAAITDHGPALHIAGGVSADGFRRQHAEIEGIQTDLDREAIPFRILRSVELNIARDGSVDLSSEELAGFDIVLGAFHSQLRPTSDQTERYLAALQSGAIDILAHPRGRIYNFRVGLTADWGAVFDCALEQSIALEIDAYADRQDLNHDLLKLAAERENWLSIGSDSHHPIDLPSLDLGLASALSAGVKTERILNLMTADRLLEWKRSRSQGDPAARKD